jgi:hypothetical protein
LSNLADRSAPGEEAGAGYAAPALDLLAAALLIVLAGWYTLEAINFRAPGGWRSAPGLVPAFAGITLMIMAAGLAVAAWRRRKLPSSAVDAQMDEDSISDPRRTALLIGVVFVYLLAMDAISFGVSGYVAGHYLTLGSFEITSVLCLCVLMRFFWDGRLVTIVATAVGWTAFLSLSFRNIFNIPLPG